MFRSKILVLAACIASLSLASLWAQQPNQATTVKQVRGSLYQVSGGVGNAFFYVGPDEVLVIDTRISPDAGREMLAEIRKSPTTPCGA